MLSPLIMPLHEIGLWMRSWPYMYARSPLVGAMLETNLLAFLVPLLTLGTAAGVLYLDTLLIIPCSDVDGSTHSLRARWQSLDMETGTISCDDGLRPPIL